MLSIVDPSYRRLIVHPYSCSILAVMIISFRCIDSFKGYSKPSKTMSRAGLVFANFPEHVLFSVGSDWEKDLR